MLLHFGKYNFRQWTKVIDDSHEKSKNKKKRSKTIKVKIHVGAGDANE